MGGSRVCYSILDRCCYGLLDVSVLSLCSSHVGLFACAWFVMYCWYDSSCIIWFLQFDSFVNRCCYCWLMCGSYDGCKLGFVNSMLCLWQILVTLVSFFFEYACDCWCCSECYHRVSVATVDRWVGLLSIMLSWELWIWGMIGQPDSWAQFWSWGLRGLANWKLEFYGAIWWIKCVYLISGYLFIFIWRFSLCSIICYESGLSLLYSG